MGGPPPAVERTDSVVRGSASEPGCRALPSFDRPAARGTATLRHRAADLEVRVRSPLARDLPATSDRRCRLPAVRASDLADSGPRGAAVDRCSGSTCPSPGSADPELSLLVPNRRRGRSGGLDRRPGAQRGAHDRGVRAVVPRGPRRRPASSARSSSSTARPTRTAERAVAAGARVLRTPEARSRAGLHRRHPVHPRPATSSWATPTARTTSASSKPFVDKFREGYEFVMGSRFKGYIEPGSMPPHHRYFGTPVTTWILNRVYSSKFSDIHCGMRGITLDALEAHGPRSRSRGSTRRRWCSSRCTSSCAPARCRSGSSRTARAGSATTGGWAGSRRSPAAWINLRAMFVYGADFFVLRARAACCSLLGLLLMLPVTLRTGRPSDRSRSR